MVIFISSVRRGLEEERDSLPGLIAAIGHDALRFEDFTAAAVPPRQACLDGVSRANLYLLLLGEHYGEPVPDTGLAPTEEEFTAAVRKGIPILVFRKIGPDPDERQAEFIGRVESYTQGRFRATYSTTADLLTKAAASIRAAQAGPRRVSIQEVDESMTVPRVGPRIRPSGGSRLEVHLVPTKTLRLSATEIAGIRPALTSAGRRWVFGESLGVQAIEDSESTAVYVQSRDVAAGLSLSRDAAVSAWVELKRDAMGSIVSVASLTDQIADMIRAMASLVRSTGKVAVAAALDPVGMAVEGDPHDLGRRTSASLTHFAMNMDAGIRLDPEQAVEAEDLVTAARDLAQELATRIIQAYRSSPC